MDSKPEETTKENDPLGHMNNEVEKIEPNEPIAKSLREMLIKNGCHQNLKKLNSAREMIRSAVKTLAEKIKNGDILDIEKAKVSIWTGNGYSETPGKYIDEVLKEPEFDGFAMIEEKWNNNCDCYPSCTCANQRMCLKLK